MGSLFLRLPVAHFDLSDFGQTDYDKVFFTSDLHFGHGGKTKTEGVIKYCNRPWKHQDEMDVALEEKWNDTVPEQGLVFVLGDVSFHPRKVIRKIIPRLKGRKILIAGNHDHKDNCPAMLFPDRFKAMSLTTSDAVFTLSHMYEDDWGPYILGLDSGHVIQLHGHSHGSVGDLPQRIDVGVDCWDYKPVSLAEILDYVSGMRSGRCVPRRPSGILRRGDA